MNKSIAIIGTLDTKGDQVDYLRGKIEGKGQKAVVIDTGVLGDPMCKPTVTKHQVAYAAGGTLDDVIALGNETEAMEKMTGGVREILKDLNAKRAVDGVLAVGGTMGTALALKVMDVLPLTMPKVVLSTIANSPAIDPDFFSSNVIMMPWLGGLWGINEVARAVLDQAAGLITGATEAYQRKPLSEKKLIGVTSLGMAAVRFLNHLRPALEERNYEVAVFHGTGMSTRLLERAIEEGSVDAVLDMLGPGELLGEMNGSLFGPGPHRFEAAAKRGVPQIVNAGMNEMFNWGAYKPIPKELADRQIFQHNFLLWMIRTSVDEKVRMAKLLAEKLNRSTGPVAVLVPLKNFPSLAEHLGSDRPEGLDEVRNELKRNLSSKVKYVEVNASPDDEQFADVVLSLLDQMMEERG